MIYKRFYINVIIRFIIVLFTCLWLTYEINNPKKVYTIICISAFLAIQAYSFIYYFNKTNRELARFFLSLKDKDSSYSFTQKKGSRSFNELADVLNETSELIRNARIEKEKQFLYLQYVVEHVGIGLITYTKEGKVKLYNKAGQQLLGIKNLKEIQQLNKLHESFENILQKIKPGEQRLVKIKIGDELLQLLIRSTEFKIQKESLKLVSFQDFKNELEENELESWQKLIRVLTHEIMNSITPVTTLTLAIKKGFTKNEKPKSATEVGDEDIKDAIVNTDLIEERSKGLINFVDNYRSITRISKINLKKINVQKLIRNITNLFIEEFQNNNIKYSIEVEPSTLEFSGDEKLIEQILINLLKNSLQALKGRQDGEINLISFLGRDNRMYIQVFDNGAGIPEDIIDDIFIPFFTTKKSGSGIGLSLSRQIMRLHKGTISVQSKQGKETVFTLRF